MKTLVIMLVAVTVIAVGFPFDRSAKAFGFDWLNSFDSIFQAIQPSANTLANLPRQTLVISDQAVAQSTTLIPSVYVGTKKATKKHTVAITAYSSTPDQTDASPFITASGTHVRDGVVATNLVDPNTGRRYAFGTMIKIPELYGDKVFVVEDRMNSRYIERVDIWFPTREAAVQFGKKTVTIEIVS